MSMNPIIAEGEQTAQSGRELEASILTKAADKLRECQNNWGADDRQKNLYDALKYNQTVWTIFQGELAKDDNPLPFELRQNLLRLAAFIDKRIYEVMNNPSSEQLNAIININLNIAAGLRGSIG